MPDPATRRRGCVVHSEAAACSCVDLVSGFVRDAIAARNCSTNANVQRRGYVGQQPCSPELAEARQHKAAITRPQIKAEGRVGRLGGMRLEPTRVSVGVAESNQNPHETSRTSSEAISIRWRHVFPPGPLPQTSGDLRRVDWSQKLAAYSLCAFACRERVEGATAALYTFLKRRTGRAVAFVQN